MIINIQDKLLTKSVNISEIDVSITYINFFEKRALFKVEFLNNIFINDDINYNYIEIKDDEYLAWGDNDEYIINLILNKLGLDKKE